MVLEPDEMLLGQHQVFPLLPEHGAARLDLAMLQHLPILHVLPDVFPKASRCSRRGRRERFGVVVGGQFVAAEGAEDGAGALQAGFGERRSLGVWRFHEGAAPRYRAAVVRR